MPLLGAALPRASGASSCCEGETTSTRTRAVNTRKPITRSLCCSRKGDGPGSDAPASKSRVRLSRHRDWMKGPVKGLGSGHLFGAKRSGSEEAERRQAKPRRDGIRAAGTAQPTAARSRRRAKRSGCEMWTLPLLARQHEPCGGQGGRPSSQRGAERPPAGRPSGPGVAEAGDACAKRREVAWAAGRTPYGVCLIDASSVYPAHGPPPAAPPSRASRSAATPARGIASRARAAPTGGVRLASFLEAP